MRVWPPRSPRVVAGIALAAPLLSGCGLTNLVSPSSKPAGVQIDKQNIALVFGTPPAKKTRPVVQQPPVATTPQTPLEQLLNPLPPPPPPPVSTPFPGPPPVTVPSCPPPGPNTGAAREITSDVRGRVKPGVYRFLEKGSLTITPLPAITVSGDTVRIISDVKVNSNGSYDYTEDEVVGLLFHLKLGYHVVPGQGIYLSSFRLTYKKATQSFTPALPVKIFQLPATPQVPTIPTQPEQPVQFADVGVDPVNGATMVSQGTISLTSSRVNGCGEAADGWHVDATWSFQFGQNAQPFQLTYTVAPQYGGLIIADRVQATDTLNASSTPTVIRVDMKSRFGSLHPKPLRKSSP